MTYDEVEVILKKLVHKPGRYATSDIVVLVLVLVGGSMARFFLYLLFSTILYCWPCRP
jgi:hypothetical protein